MIKNTYESVMMWIMFFLEKIENGFKKYYPYIAFVFAILFSLVVARNFELHNYINWTKVFLTAWIFTLVTLFWLIITKRKK